MKLRPWFFLIFLVSFYQISYNKCPTLQQGEDEDDNSLPTSDVPYYQDYCTGGFVRKVDYKVQNPSVKRNANAFEFSTFSACLRCAVCLAVAEKINDTLIVAHKTAHWKTLLDEEYVIELLRSLCLSGFENYGYREVNGKKLICEGYSWTKPVLTELDGLWTKKLQALCHYYLDEYGEINLYDTWFYGGLHAPQDMVNMLCRSYGIFRECINIKEELIAILGSGSETMRVVCP